MRRPLRTAFLLGIVVGLVAAVVRALRGDQGGAVGAGTLSLPRPTPALRPTSGGSANRGEDRGTVAAMPAAASPLDEVADEVVAPVTEDLLPDPPPDAAAVTADPPVAPAVPPAPAAAEDTTPGPASTWVAPVAGGCPEGYPIKAKASSRIFHIPEGAFYGRTVPDRCYPTVGAAAADGFRASKR